jgi:hypothetical protein
MIVHNPTDDRDDRAGSAQLKIPWKTLKGTILGEGSRARHTFSRKMKAELMFRQSGTTTKRPYVTDV